MANLFAQNFGSEFQMTTRSKDMTGEWVDVFWRGGNAPYRDGSLRLHYPFVIPPEVPFDSVHDPHWEWGHPTVLVIVMECSSRDAIVEFNKVWSEHNRLHYAT